ncbi:type II toxin-antitoxin system antitoxin SocA domain-containing protein [Anaerobutyricum hallii]|uniref:type II toxin-antitoxin system antitoxin SocA domain-containing protein n=1 Tax=Anaerobutyricum hallii TaxID=39488 RepID=UPI003522E72F
MKMNGVCMCTECQKEQSYTLRKEFVKNTFRGKDYYFRITVAVCDVCGAKVAPHGLMDKNTEEIMQQYRERENLVSVDDIEHLMKLYKIGKAPLSITLGFGEITITRYLAGQLPTKKYSDIIKKALVSPAFMKSLLNENRDKITETAYDRAMFAANSLENAFTVSQRMLNVIAYIFSCMGVVSLVTLQRLLYFSQGITLALHDEPLFEEDIDMFLCVPIFSDVNDLLKDFKYDPTTDARFSIIKNTESILSKSECQIISLVLSTFGIYSEIILNKCVSTHTYLKTDSLNISKNEVKKYFDYLNLKYDFSKKEGINKYLLEILNN